MVNDEVLVQWETKKILNISKWQLKFNGHVMRKQGMKSLILTAQIDGNRDKRKQRETYLMNLRIIDGRAGFGGGL